LRLILFFSFYGATDSPCKGGNTRYHGDIRETRLAMACQQLAYSLTQSGRAKCMACGTLKLSEAGWKIVGYMPGNPDYPPIAYLVCGKCFQSKSALHKAQLMFETRSRAVAEERRQ